ncbi:class F sortase [Streptomyces sp. FIT100]|uniref:class F sortase n=1 Tax=Streptomyces sp. FIT100 TaxID=2837956 RepID=UPI0022078268|nr:class F sortase [Streptomyces sp. FIT100]UUN27583.1 class F sortase [Streptomyces sp. FIT100]
MIFRQPSGPSPYRSEGTFRSLRKALLWPVVSVGVGALLIYGAFDATAGNDRSGKPAAAMTPRAAGPSSAPHASPGPALSASNPKRLQIPYISVDAPFIPLGLSPTGQLNSPPVNNNNLVGWYKDGPTPGERGTAIVAGHFDTMTGPAVFVGLSELKPGRMVDITREDGTIATFKVDSVETFDKKTFPSARVYDDTPQALLRLITCAGEYDKSAKDYNQNLVVFAHLESSRRVGEKAPTPAAPSPKAPSPKAPNAKVPSAVAPSPKPPSTKPPTAVAPGTKAPSPQVPSAVAPTAKPPAPVAPSTKVPTPKPPSAVAPSSKAPGTIVPSPKLTSPRLPSTVPPASRPPSPKLPGSVPPAPMRPSAGA